MKKFPCFAAFLALLFLAINADAQQKKPTTWEQKKAARFKPLTDEHKSLIAKAVPERPAVEPQKARRVLCFYRCEGFIHSSIPFGNLAAQEMGSKSGAFRLDLADTYDVFTAENLKKYDCVLFNNTTHLKFRDPSQEKALLDFVSSGKGFAGFHAASDNFNAHPQCSALVGGRFNGHPWTAGGMWAFKLDDPEHVLNRAFDGSGFWHRDEIYQYNPDTYQGPKVLRVLVSLDMTKEEVSKRVKDGGVKYPPGPREVPVSWVRRFGQGRVFYTNFGHREDTYWNPTILKHMLDGVQYAIGDLEADDIPSAEVGLVKPSLAPAGP